MQDTDESTWNEDIIDDIEEGNVKDLIVFSRDWTVDTMYSQIEKGNIDLDPKFQRRNAWNDDRRSKLIESLIIGIPVPGIVLAENKEKKKSFIVIDGKQRLLTIAGYINPELGYWINPTLKKVVKEIDGLTFKELSTNPKHADKFREFNNADIRCTVISNYKNEDVLYDIFYRLNTESSPLATQELRQVLIKGPFAEYLVLITNQFQPIHEVLGLEGPDSRLKDIELILRYISFKLFGEKYSGNLKKFLDDSMRTITQEWEKYNPIIERCYQELNTAISNMIRVFPENSLGKKFTGEKWERRFNKVLFEVEAYYFSQICTEEINSENTKEFISAFCDLCTNDSLFKRSIESTTKTPENYRIRYEKFREIFNKSYKKEIIASPFN